jgi:hypothetical protein
LRSVFLMKTLPFVVQPKKKFTKVKIGTENTGKLEIERRGYLTVSEKSFVDAVTQGSDGITAIVNLATRIGTKTKHTTEEAFSAVMKAVQGDLEDPFALKIREEYPDELSNILSQMTDSIQKRNIAATTILIRSRIDSEWTVDDTLEQDPELILAFADFYALEEAGIQPEIVDPSEQAEEQDESNAAADIVGKSTEENGAE